jgi:hypothetical protein
MKHIKGGWRCQDDNDNDVEPYLDLEGGKCVMDRHAWCADWKDLTGQHEAVEKAAKMSTGEVVCIENGDDNYWFCNEDNIFQVK